MEFWPAASFEALGDIRHDGNAGPPYLIPKPKIFCKGPDPGMKIYLPGQFSGFLPGYQVFKPFYFRLCPQTSEILIQSRAPCPSPFFFTQHSELIPQSFNLFIVLIDLEPCPM